MDFYRRYELIEPLSGTGTKSFRGRQVSTAREVAVHLLVGGRTPENEQLLARLRAMPAQSFSKLIEVGDNEGTPFVVTMAPPYQHLAEWLEDQEKAAAQSAQRLSRAGAYRAPVAPPEITGPNVQPPIPPTTPQTRPPSSSTPPASTPPVTARPAAPIPSTPAQVPQPAPQPPFTATTGAASEAEPTLRFSRPPSGIRPAMPAPAASSVPAEPPARQAPPATPPVIAEPGEFTKMFRAAGPEAPTKSFDQPKEPAAPTPASAPLASEPGEFTRMFQAKGAPAPKPETSLQDAETLALPVQPSPAPPHEKPTEAMPLPGSQPSAPAPNEHGEFTRMFQSAQPAPPPPVTTPAAAPMTKPPSQPKAPAVPQAPAPVAAPNEPGEFTRMFQTASGNVPAKQVTPLQTGENLAYNGPAKAPPPPVAKAPTPPAAEPAPPTETGPGEFTRMFQGPAAPPQRSLQTVQTPIPTVSTPKPIRALETPQAPAYMAPPTPKVPSATPAPAAEERGPGEFTQLFKTGASVPKPVAPISPANPAAAPPKAQPAPPPVPSESGPGEFTKLFQTGPATPSPVAARPQAPVSPPPMANAPSPASAPPVSSFPGEFSRIFQDSPKSPAPEGIPATPPPSTGPGEFTRMFNPQLPDRPEPQENWVPKPARPQQGGTFRPMLPPDRPSQEEKPQGEFTRFFKATPASPSQPGPQPATMGPLPGSPLSTMPAQAMPGPKAPQPSKSSQAGEFTRMFGRPGQDAPAPFAPSGGGSGAATGAFSAPPIQPAAPAVSPGAPAVSPAPAPEPQGPSEYTMMISRPPVPQEGAGGGAPAAPAASGGGGSPMIQMNVQAPQMPMVRAPQIQAPYIPQPQVQIPGVQVQGPHIPQPMAPQLSIPQPTIPNATVTAKGSNMLERIIIFLLGLLIGIGIGILLKK